ncbi:MAG: type III-B CRISPR-associated protein Cas10/Cmr2 [Anaerolinea sp. 4484_236]|nr:MAG: type III-B CRISPR-associated protein Cas10/Cmr2 [Anaerolinea sp. 4484_236]
MQYLFLCAIGPVQDFIATARRSRDLWYGSWMLSELSKAAARELAQQFGADNLIFPAPEKLKYLEPGSDLGVANKIVAVIDADPAKVGQRVESAVKKRLKTLRDAALNKVERLDGNLDSRTLAENQIDDLLEFYWVTASLAAEDDYSSVRDTTEALMAARKNTRDFRQSKGANKLKSSLDGNRESVIPKMEYAQRGDSGRERERKANALYRHYRARPGERLSGVDLLKRLGEPEKKGSNAPKFYSTSHFAALPFMQMLDDKHSIKADVFLNEIYNAYKSVDWIVPSISNDGSLLYESRLSDSIPAGDVLKSLQEKLKGIFEDHKVSKRPSPYYALLRADGDNMGLIIDGQKSQKDHRKVSQSLSEFALEVPKIVEAEEYQGKVIYAGGDDILAYLPLHTVLKCAAELDERFQEQMGKFKGKDKNGKEVSPSLSAGIVIAHHLTPLADVLAMSKNAERKGKDIKGKNALVIVLSKRSGADREIAGKWGPLNIRLQKMIKLHRKKAISKGTAYELQKLNRDFAEANISIEVVNKEALRIIKRKRESGSDKKIGDYVIKQFEEWLKKVPLYDLAQEMIVANIFATAQDMAGVKLPVEKEEI